MAYEQYEDTPLSNFPAAEDNWSRMSNVSVGLLAIAKEYSDLYTNGNIDSANALLAKHPQLRQALFTPERWNQLRDAIIALQRFFLEDVESMITEVARSTVGINDAAAGEDAQLNAYSVAKVNEIINGLNNELTNRYSQVRTVTLAAAGWSATAPFTQRINLAGVRSTDSPLAFINDAQTKAARKAQLKQLNKHVDRLHTYNGYVVFECDSSRPTINLNLVVKGA